MGNIKANKKDAAKAKLGKTDKKRNLGKFVVIPADQILAERSSAYAYMF